MNNKKRLLLLMLILFIVFRSPCSFANAQSVTVKDDSQPPEGWENKYPYVGPPGNPPGEVGDVVYREARYAKHTGEKPLSIVDVWHPGHAGTFIGKMRMLRGKAIEISNYLRGAEIEISKSKPFVVDSSNMTINITTTSKYEKGFNLKKGSYSSGRQLASALERYLNIYIDDSKIPGFYWEVQWIDTSSTKGYFKFPHHPKILTSIEASLDYGLSNLTLRSLTLDSTNNIITFSLQDDTSYQIILSPVTYTWGGQIAREIQKQINQHDLLSKLNVRVGWVPVETIDYQNNELTGSKEIGFVEFSCDHSVEQESNEIRTVNGPSILGLDNLTIAANDLYVVDTEQEKPYSSRAVYLTSFSEWKKEVEDNGEKLRYVGSKTTFQVPKGSPEGAQKVLPEPLQRMEIRAYVLSKYDLPITYYDKNMMNPKGDYNKPGNSDILDVDDLWYMEFYGFEDEDEYINELQQYYVYTEKVDKLNEFQCVGLAEKAYDFADLNPTIDEGTEEHLPPSERLSCAAKLLYGGGAAASNAWTWFSNLFRSSENDKPHAPLTILTVPKQYYSPEMVEAEACSPQITYPPHGKTFPVNEYKSEEITITFAPDNIDRYTLNPSNISIEGYDSEQHDFDLEYNAISYELKLRPKANDKSSDSEIFAYGETVEVTITTDVQDLAGNTLEVNGNGDDYFFTFNFQKPPKEISISASFNSDTIVTTRNCHPFEMVIITGTALYDNGLPVQKSVVEIKPEWLEKPYTVVTDENGSFTLEFFAHSDTTENEQGYEIEIKVIGYLEQEEKSKVTSCFLIVDSFAEGSNYSFAGSITCKDLDENNFFQDETLFFRSDDQQVLIWLLLENVYINSSAQPITIYWKCYTPEDELFGEPISYTIPFPEEEDYHTEYPTSEGWDISALNMQNHEGLWRYELWIDEGEGEQLVDSFYFIMRYIFNGHWVFRGNEETPVAEETNLLFTNDKELTSLLYFPYTTEQVDVKWDFYYSDTSYQSIEKTLDDPGNNCTYEIVYSSLEIDGTEIEYMAGDWSIEVNIKKSAGEWKLCDTRPFRIEENPAIPPDGVTVEISPQYPMPGDGLIFTVTAHDNHHLQKVVLYWDDGNKQSESWEGDDEKGINSANFNISHSIGSGFTSGQDISYWVEAWDESGNSTLTTRQTLKIGIYSSYITSGSNVVSGSVSPVNATVELYMNGKKQDEILATDGSYEFTGLSPYQFYQVRVTSYLSSDEGYYPQMEAVEFDGSSASIDFELASVPQIIVSDYYTTFSGIALVNESEVLPGDVIIAKDYDGTVCGLYIVREEGEYGEVRVYGDNESTEVDEGALSGENIQFHINSEFADGEGPDNTSWEQDQEKNVDIAVRGEIAQVITLHKGWNCISLKIRPLDFDPESLFYEIKDSLITARKYDFDSVKVYDPAIPKRFCTLNEITAGNHGFQIKLSEPAKFMVCGQEIGDFRAVILRKGWNIVPFYGIEEEDVESFFGNVDSDIQTVRAYYPDSVKVYDPSVPVRFNTLKQVKPGYGYKVKMKDTEDYYLLNSD